MKPRQGEPFWLVNGILMVPTGSVRGAIGMRAGRIIGIRRTAPKGSTHLDVHGRHVAPGFVDLHIWGEPDVVARQEVRTGTTSFLTTVGPLPPELLASRLVQLSAMPVLRGARCLGVHLEGPFLNPLRAGALASRWLRPPTNGELRQINRCGEFPSRLITIAPEIPRGVETIRWCARHQIRVSLGHSDASATVTRRAIAAGATAVTHIFNGMRSLHHRDPALLGEALTEDQLTAMVILDGVHVQPQAFQLLWRCKGSRGIALTTDSIRHQAKRPKAKGGAFYTPSGILAGSRLTMMAAVRNAVTFTKMPLSDAVQMATENPARLIGRDHEIGSLSVGRRADVTVFDARFRVTMTLVGGNIVYQRA